MLFAVLLCLLTFCAFLCGFYSERFTLFCCHTLLSPSDFHFALLGFLSHTVTHFLQLCDGGFCVFIFARHAAHCFLSLVYCSLYVVKKLFPEEAYFNRSAKGRLTNIKITRRSKLSA